ncbi:TetR family transcriptional regulator [Periweissella fabalis]|uniref:TetR/AcrR family transcriptional regulator n=1 Tax=Periweissella fabalis TaxID=1070421 RepID=A0A7X6N4S5_9LACO|nr:TetR/AcrR family transcriptional regulator [Periweissella fabalis]NKZ23873.1 TetR/AcrR family transcriptional regulator [Periweissella fabalis]
MFNDKFNSYDRKNKRAFQIGQAAYDLITEKPFNDITMTMIAQRAQVAKGTIFNYFNSKEDIYMAIDINGYTKYFEQVKAELVATTITNQTELKMFLVHTMKILAREYQVIILIHSLRRFTLEAHADPSQTERGRSAIYQLLSSICQTMVTNVPDIDINELIHAFIIQGSILNGLLTFANINKFNGVNLAIEMPATEIAIEKEACQLFELYLNSILK